MSASTGGSRRRDTTAQTTDVPSPLHGQQVNSSQFHGPHFICNMEGLVLELSGNGVISSKFRGDRAQQWLLQPDPRVKSRVALASLEDGRYLGMIQRAQAWSATPALPDIRRTPYYWEITKTEGTYRFTLPNPPGSCRIKEGALGPDEDVSALKYLILENTTKVQAALRIGEIGQWAYPGHFVYHTIGEAGQIRVYNHLTSEIYAAVSDGHTSGSSGCGQWPVKPNNWQYWRRTSDEDVHVSLGNCIGAQSAQVFRGRVGKVLHIQNLPRRVEWEGIVSVLAKDARYTANDSSRADYIGVKNNLKFSIYVIVLSTGEGGTSSQYTMYPGNTSFWHRQGPESVLVGAGGAPGAPRAFLGKLGFTLHIDQI